MRRLYLVDSILWFNLSGYTANAQPIFDEPVVIKGKWDTVRNDLQMSDNVETIARTVTVYPDRVLSVGSVLVLGDEEYLDSLSPEVLKKPLLIPTAVTIKAQSTIAEFGRSQKASYPIGYKSKYLTIEVTCG